MHNKIECIKCQAMASVVKYVSDANQLALVGNTLGLGEPAKPYYVVDCPNCGKRVVEADIPVIRPAGEK